MCRYFWAAMLTGNMREGGAGSQAENTGGEDLGQFANGALIAFNVNWLMIFHEIPLC